jgi:hypothetical protein
MIGVHGNSSRIDISTLPSESIRIRVLVNDGYYTTISKPIQINIPSRPASVVNESHRW